MLAVVAPDRLRRPRYSALGAFKTGHIAMYWVHRQTRIFGLICTSFAPDSVLMEALVERHASRTGNRSPRLRLTELKSTTIVFAGYSLKLRETETYEESQQTARPTFPVQISTTETKNPTVSWFRLRLQNKKTISRFRNQKYIKTLSRRSSLELRGLIIGISKGE